MLDYLFVIIVFWENLRYFLFWHCYEDLPTMRRRGLCETSCSFLVVILFSLYSVDCCVTHIYIWLFQAFHTQTPWTLCTINMLHIICTTVYSIVKPTSSLLLASSIGTIPSTRRGGVLVICWYLRISVDFPRRFSISVSHIWLSCSPLVIQWCFYHH